jgi:drug/metabolite transporter (DMT)-like permease
VASKYALGYVSPFTLVAARYALASLVFVPVYLAGRRAAVDRQTLGLLALASFIGLTVSSWTQFEGTALSTAHAGALITSSAPAFMVLFAALLLQERITGQKVAALVVATAGVAMVVGPADIGAGKAAMVGDLLLVVAGVTWALYSVMIRQLSLRLPSVTVTTYVTVFGTLLNLPVGIAQATNLAHVPSAVWWSTLYIGLISTALAYYLWNKGLQLMDAGSASIFFFAQPLTGTFFAWLLLGERLNLGFFLGGALILLGVAIASASLPSGLRRGARPVLNARPGARTVTRVSAPADGAHRQPPR